MLSSLEVKVAKLEGSIKDVRKTLEIVEGCTNDLDLMKEQLRDYMMEALKLKGEFAICKVAQGNRMLAPRLKQRKIDVSKPKEFNGTRSTRDKNNIFGGIEQYFYAMGIKDDAIKEEARAKLCQLTQQSIIQEYVKDFSELMFQISDLSMVETESFFEIGPRKDKFEIFKPKKMSNGRGDPEEEREVKNGNGDNDKNDSNGRSHNGKWKPNNIMGTVKCFLFNGSHMVRDCSRKFVLSVINEDDELNKATMRLGLIVHSIEFNRVGVVTLKIVAKLPNMRTNVTPLTRLRRRIRVTRHYETKLT
ncbi:hypothetical protein Goshw_014653, partial [Gossypium schwendimanii]|nr:hypothetical protein [Gossypium schwendimanii]